MKGYEIQQVTGHLGMGAHFIVRIRNHGKVTDSAYFKQKIDQPIGYAFDQAVIWGESQTTGPDRPQSQAIRIIQRDRLASADTIAGVKR